MFRLMLRSFRFYRRMHLGVFFGAMLAAAALTGALLVGDSVDYSLRESATMRLGGVHFAAHTRGNFVDEQLPQALAKELNNDVAAVLQLPGMAIFQNETTGDPVQINQVQLLGIDDTFWAFADNATLTLGPNETAINEKLAKALGVAEGDELSMRVINPSLMARDAPLSWRSDENTQRRRYTIKSVVPDTQLGRFDLSPSQLAPYNAFVNRRFLQEQIELPQRINLMLAGEGSTRDEIDAALSKVLLPEHIGMTFHAHDSGIVQLQTDRVFIDGETERAAMTDPRATGTLTYLVNEIAHGENKTPYSFVVAGPVPANMRDDEIVINQWVADQVNASVGERINITYYELSPSNEFLLRSREFTVHSIRSMESLVAEKELMPVFPGLSDVESCTDWDVGMPMDEALLEDEANEVYWDAYRQTPKALVTLKAGQDMWANRFGALTSIRIPGDAESVVGFRETVRKELDPAKSGLAFMAVRDEADRAVNQAMDFGGLFLGMSFFLIFAALMLTGLLFVFGIQQRASEFGVLLAMGFRPIHVRTLLFGEGMLVAVTASIVGAILGTLYTRALVFGLSRYWQGAVAGAAIKYHAEPITIIMGATIGVASALAAMMLATWRQSKHSARELLMLDFAQDRPSAGQKKNAKRVLIFPIAGIVISVAIIIYAEVADIMDISYAFFGAGSLLLASGIGLCRYGLITVQSRHHQGDMSIRQLALQNLARRRGRSLTVTGLLACGCFLVFSVSAMQEDLTAHAQLRSSGTGGFSLVADATVPILEDPTNILKTPGVAAASIKVRDGDDASCLNLNRAQTPRLLGVHVSDFVSRGAFSSEKDRGEIWKRLDLELEDGVIPALVGDANTAMWTLKKKAGIKNGDVLLYLNEAGEEIKVKLVGKLPMRLSVFQGTILISDTAFTRMYPSESGYRMFLVDTPSHMEQETTAKLRQEFDRYGLDVVTTSERLIEFYSVETTYLAMFLVLGGIGLALGSIGMAIVVLRNLFEQSAEIAILRALGFTQKNIYHIVGMEYGILVVAGLSVGTIAAMASVIPAVFASTTSVDVGVQIQVFLLVTLTATVCTMGAVFSGIRKNDVGALRHE